MKAFEAGSLNVGDSLVAVGAASDRTAPKVHNLRTAMSSFDGVLASMGVNIGAEVRGLNDLADASGKTFTQLGLVATAGLAAGAALAGWKIGRLVADFFDLDKAIGNATAKMLGWGNVSGETAGAQQDVVTRAIERGAAVTITYSEALQFNADWLTKRHGALVADAKAQKENEDALKKLLAEQERWGLIMAELNTAGANWFETLKGVDGEVVEAVKFYLQAGVAQGTLATAYGLTAVQIKAVSTAMREELDIAKILSDFEANAAKNQAILDERAMRSMEARTDAIRKAAAEAERLNAAFLADALSAAQASDASFMNQPSGISREVFGGGAGVPRPTTLNTGAGFHLKEFSLRAGGGPVSSGKSYVVGERGPELFTPGSSGFVTPNGGGPNITIYVNGTAEDVARKIADKIMQTVKSGTKVGLS